MDFCFQTKICCFECPCYEGCTISLVPFFSSYGNIWHRLGTFSLSRLSWICGTGQYGCLHISVEATFSLSLSQVCFGTKCPNQHKNKQSLQKHIVDAHSVIMARYLEDRNMSCSMRKRTTILTKLKSKFCKKEFRTQRS